MNATFWEMIFFVVMPILGFHFMFAWEFVMTCKRKDAAERITYRCFFTELAFSLGFIVPLFPLTQMVTALI